MKLIFWHHDIHGPFSLDELWQASHGFAGSVGRLRLMFWMSARGHEVYLVGNVKAGSCRGVVAIPGEPWSDPRLASQPRGSPPILVMQTAPTEEAWRRLRGLSRFTTILWLAGPLSDLRWIERARMGELASMVCISEYQRNLYRIYQGFERLEVCYLGVDLDLIAQAAAEKSPVPVALFCSIPRRTKGLHHLLKAWRLVHRAMPEARLWVSGSARIHAPDADVAATDILDPDLEQEFSDFFGRLPDSLHQSGIELLGAPKESRHVYRAMKAAWLAVVNCNWRGSLEMFCRSAVEAQSAGLPVVGARAGALREVVRDGVTGTLIPRKDVHALADAMIRLFQDHALRTRMGDAAISWSRRFADYTPLAVEWEAIIARAERRQPAPVGSSWRADFLRTLGYGSLRAWGRNQIRGTQLEKRLLELMRS